MIYISTQNFPPDIGGIQVTMFAVANELARQGETVVVFADEYMGQDSREIDAALPYKVYRFGGIKPVRRRMKAWALSRAMRKTPGALLCDTWKSLELFPSLKRKGKVVCLAHGMEFPVGASPSKADRVRETFAKADHILANSHFTADRLRPFLPSQREVEVLLHGIATPTIPGDQDRSLVAREVNERGPVLLTVGRIEARKGHDKVIEGLPQLIKIFPQLLYVIVGDGPDKGRLQELTQSLGLEPHVLFAGRAPDTVKSAWFERTDLFVMPSRAEGNSVEGFGLVYLEAAWFGKPSIAGLVGGAGDAVANGETGLLCDSENSAKVAEAIQSLLSDETKLRAFGAAAETRVKSQFMWPSVIQSLRRYF